MIKRCLILLTILFAFPAFALSLGDAKTQGLVGERLDGYIGAVSSNPGSDTLQLVDTVNSLRKQEYVKIAAKNGQPVKVVETLAAKKLIERAGPGEYYMNASGEWRRK